MVAEYFEQINEHHMLCQSCGMCEGICPTGSIKMKPDFAGQFIPAYDVQKCISCQRCITVCPRGTGLSGKPSVIGPYYKIYLGKSNRTEFVENGSSGGVATALLKYGLDKGIFSEVLTESYKDSPVVAEPVYTTKPQEESGSKYVAAPLCAIYDSRKEHLAVTALPCQAKAVRKANGNAFIIGLFCSKLSLMDLVYYMCEKDGHDRGDIAETSYRKGKWPGNFHIKYEDPESHQTSDYKATLNRSEFSAAYNSYNFSSSGCLLCDDYFAQEADISLGDPWGKKQYVDGYLGETVIIVRTKRGEELIENAIKDQIITVREGNLEALVKGHLKEIYNKKTALIQRIDFLNREIVKTEDFDTKALIPTKNFPLLNRYAIHNNWKRRRSGSHYKSVFKIPLRWMYVTRFAHAFLLTRHLKYSGNYEVYCDIAKTERIESEK